MSTLVVAILALASIITSITIYVIKKQMNNQEQIIIFLKQSVSDNEHLVSYLKQQHDHLSNKVYGEKK